MAKTNPAAGVAAFSSRTSHRPRSKRLSRVMIDALEPRRLLAPWITTEVAGGVSGGAGDVEVADGKAYVLMNGLTIFDVSATGTPVQLGRVSVPGARGVTVAGSYAYVWGGAYSPDPGFRVVDVSNPAAPVVVSSLLFGGGVTSAWIAGSYAYVVTSTVPGLQIIDISNPSAPTLKGSLAINWADGVTVAGSYAYVAGSYAYISGSDLTVVDVADPANPVKMGSCHTDGGGGQMAVAGTTVYSAGIGMELIDVSNPAAPVEITCWYGLSKEALDLKVADSKAYLIEGNEVDITSVSDPSNPTTISQVATWGKGRAVAVCGSMMCVALDTDGLQVFNVADPTRPDKTGVYDPPDNPNCVAFSGSIAYVNGGTYASSLHIIDIQNFDAPTWIGRRNTDGYINDMAVSGSYLYTAGSSSLEIFNISTPSDPILVYDGSGMGAGQGIAICGSYAYIASSPLNSGFRGLQVFNIATPSATRLVGQYAISSGAPDVAVSGTLAYVAAGTYLRIIDVSDPANMVELASLSFPSDVDHVFVAGSRVYIGGNGGSYIVDVSNPVAPVVLNRPYSIRDPIWAVSGNLAYTPRGIFDVSDPAAIREIGGYTLFSSQKPGSIALYEDSKALVANGEFETVRFNIRENEPATDITLSQTSIAENLPIGTVIGTLGSTCMNPSNTFTYGVPTIPGVSSGSYFTVSGNQLKTNYVFNYEDWSTYPILVRSTDAVGQWFEKAFTITVTDVNERPTNITLSATSIAENQPVGTVVGTLSSSDPDAGNTFSYSLVSGTGSTDNASFTISGNQLLAAASFHYQTKNSYSIRVRTTDQGGLYTEKTFTISVTADTTAPTVTAVYVRGSTWNTNYLSFLAANLVGSSSTYGFAIPVGSGDTQLQTLPWRNLNQISIRFSEDVSVAQAQFAIVGSVGSYSVSGFSYSSTDHVATWTLSAVIGPDKLYVAVPGSGTTPVQDTAGNTLDGEWNNPTSYSQAGSTDTFPSGNGTAGGDFAFRFDVLPGDSTGGSLGKVNVADVAQTKSRSSLPVTASTYRSDFDGNNLVNVADVAYVKSKSSIYSLPVNPPVLPLFSAVSNSESLLGLGRSLRQYSGTAFLLR